MSRPSHRLHFLSLRLPCLSPSLYCDQGALNISERTIPQPRELQLSVEKLCREGAFLMDAGSVSRGPPPSLQTHQALGWCGSLFWLTWGASVNEDVHQTSLKLNFSSIWLRYTHDLFWFPPDYRPMSSCQPIAQDVLRSIIWDVFTVNVLTFGPFPVLL